ncbi:hypothetical protein ACFQY0_08320 [Haloferula chungangensis]|uniref:Uncharacterized protein n=1 Tax=Haloferula chungangensis TaxID=1048331 RepID=A0ABW2L618_9BACT
MSENPYQAPTVSEVAAPAEALPEVVQIRQAHLRHEASLKGMGSLFFLGGVLVIISLLPLLTIPFAGEFHGVGWAEVLIIMMLITACVVQFVAWSGLRRLRPWSTVPAAILSALGLLAIGLGTIISIYFLYILFCKKGRFILSPAYQEIVAQTPGMKYKTPLWNWIVLGVIVLLAIAGVVYAVYYTTPY